MPSTYSRVLLLSASAGAGHLRAADALAKAFTKSGTAGEVKHIDALDYANKLFQRLYAKAYIDMVNRAPKLVGWLYDQLDKPFKSDWLLAALNKLNTKPLRRMIEEFKPDIVVCTHFLPAEIVLYLKRKERLTCPVAVVVTDFDCHAMWLLPGVDRYFVALDETKAYLKALGIDAVRIDVTGIPIDPAFSETLPRDEAAKKVGLDPAITTILISAGGFGVGKIEELVAAMKKVQHPVQVVVICGKNAALKKKLEQTVTEMVREKLDPAPSPRSGGEGWGEGVPFSGSKDPLTLPSPPPSRGRGASHTPSEASGKSRARFHIVGFTDQMQTYMAASDVLLGKPGGLTTSEALARGLAFCIVNPIPGQEERNSDHLLEEGCAIRCNNLPALAFKLDRLLDDSAKLKAMRANARRLGRPRAAMEIVRLLGEPSSRT